LKKDIETFLGWKGDFLFQATSSAGQMTVTGSWKEINERKVDARKEGRGEKVRSSTWVAD